MLYVNSRLTVELMVVQYNQEHLKVFFFLFNLKSFMKTEEETANMSVFILLTLVGIPVTSMCI